MNPFKNDAARFWLCLAGAVGNIGLTVLGPVELQPLFLLNAACFLIGATASAIRHDDV